MANDTEYEVVAHFKSGGIYREQFLTMQRAEEAFAQVGGDWSRKRIYELVITRREVQFDER